MAKEARYYEVPFMHGMKVTVGTVARKNPLMALVHSRT